MFKQLPLVKLVAENVVITLVSVIISLGCVSSAGYLFFDARTELNQLAHVTTEFERQEQEFTHANHMAHIYTASLAASPSLEQMLERVFRELSLHLHDGKVDPSFITETLTWSDDAVSQVRKERSQTSGYVFDRSILQKHQEITLQLYDTYSHFIQTIADTVRDWNTGTSEQRYARLEHLRSVKRSIDDAVNALGSVYEQTAAEIDRLQKENERQFTAAQEQYDAFSLRLWLAAFGIVASLSLLAFVVWSIAWYRPSPEPPRPQNVRRKKK